ncbi:hypothetical protein HYH03_019088 [Edaphochlamys debaryana]|uniref:FAD dependent oxidoreductase domain-containing protein n=1 Tax=Edaphochlamys debaryana TaxID=47281 RepID=A0A835XIX0_9CHLO|nr:hypothetical protein HYH03_019088 [Edaphochlamys debaryana]|eukprot:KAG2481955.1 hypothetical protein HYH03_019088 [Edaphochlamys debaryana]
MSPLSIRSPVPVPNATKPYWIKGMEGPVAPAPRVASGSAPRPQLPPAADVVIIGGGIAGVSTAYHLRKSRPDLQVVLLESRQLSHGATGRNGGLLWPALNAPWARTAERYGVAETTRMMAFELQCIREVTAFIKENGLEEEVRFSPFADGGFYAFETAAEMEAELAELELMQQYGIHTDVQPLTRAQAAAALGSAPGAFAGAARQPGVARVWGARLVRALVRKALQIPTSGCGGLIISEGAHVTEISPLSDSDVAAAAATLQGGCGAQCAAGEEEMAAAAAAAGGRRGPVANNIVSMRAAGGGRSPLALEVPVCEELDPTSTPLLQVRTSAGESLLARRVLHTTNAWASALLPELATALVPVRNHVAASYAPPHAQAPLLDKDTAVFTRGGYVYWSKREDGRLVVGGFRDTVPGMEWGVYDDSELDERIRSELLSYLPARFPDAMAPATVRQAAASNGHAHASGRMAAETEWSGILGFTQDRFPYVGPVPGRRGQFLAAGFSGHGMTRTFTVGRVLADMVAGPGLGPAGAPLDPGFPAAWLPSAARFGPAVPQAVPGPEAAAGAVYLAAGAAGAGAARG